MYKQRLPMPVEASEYGRGCFGTQAYQPAKNWKTLPLRINPKEMLDTQATACFTDHILLQKWPVPCTTV